MSSTNIGFSSIPDVLKTYATDAMALIETSFNDQKKKDCFADIVYQDSTDKYTDRIGEMGRSSGFGVWNDGETPKLSVLEEGFYQYLTQVPFGQRFAIGRLFKKFVQPDFRPLERAAKACGADAFRQNQKAMASLFNYAFADTNLYLSGIYGSTVSALGPDGKRLCSTVHACSPNNPTTWSNVSTTNAALTDESFEDAILNLDGQLDEQGEKAHFGITDGDGYILLVPVALRKKALQIIKSEKVSDSADNGINVYNGSFEGYQVEVRVCPWLTSNTAWFVLSKGIKDGMSLVMLESQPLTTDQYVDRPTKTLYVDAEMINVTGFLSGRRIYGSQGTGNGSYSA